MASTTWVSHWKTWVGIFLGAAVLVTAYAIFSRRDPALAVEIFQPTRTNLIDDISTNGKIEPIDPQIARAQLDSFVTEAFLKEGSQVRHGETVLTLDANQTRADLKQAKIELLQAQTDLSDARAGGEPDQKAQLAGDIRELRVEVDRLRKRQEALEKLFTTHASTQDEVSQNGTYLERGRAALDVLLKRQKDFADRAALQEQSASLRVQEAEERIQLLESKLESATVTSAINGNLYSFSLHKGDFVRVGDVMAEIGDLHKLRLRAFVDESDLADLKLNQPVKVNWDAMPEQTWTGKTEQIPKEVVAHGTRSVGEVLCSVNNDKLELIPNINVDVRILVQEKDNVLAVPRAAVRTESGKHFVLVLDGDRLRRREVLLGMSNSASYEILSGLAESDRVALSSNLELRDGTVVRAVETK